MNTLSAVLKRDLVSKKGHKISIGTICVLEFGSQRVTVHGNDGLVRIAYKYAPKYFSEFEGQPSMNCLERWSNDGICETPLGNIVELDGTDEYGCPSWLLALAMI